VFILGHLPGLVQWIGLSRTISIHFAVSLFVLMLSPFTFRPAWIRHSSDSVSIGSREPAEASQVDGSWVAADEAPTLLVYQPGLHLNAVAATHAASAAKLILIAQIRVILVGSRRPLHHRHDATFFSWRKDWAHPGPSVEPRDQTF
jgi:hypothetical protein